jgi:hypothetical protein
VYGINNFIVIAYSACHPFVILFSHLFVTLGLTEMACHPFVILFSHLFVTLGLTEMACHPFVIISFGILVARALMKTILSWIYL